MANYIDRYRNFRNNGGMSIVPGIIIEPLASDKKVIYKSGQTRLDKLSDDYYNNSFSGWLIMLANPEFGGLEFKIPDSSVIRIPYPFESAIERYSTALELHNTLYGR